MSFCKTVCHSHRIPLFMMTGIKFINFEYISESKLLKTIISHLWILQRNGARGLTNESDISGYWLTAASILRPEHRVSVHPPPNAARRPSTQPREGLPSILNWWSQLESQVVTVSFWLEIVACLPPTPPLAYTTKARSVNKICRQPFYNFIWTVVISTSNAGEKKNASIHN